jgi:hypothetical protein
MGKRLMITVEQNGERLKETEADIDRDEDIARVLKAVLDDVRWEDRSRPLSGIVIRIDEISHYWQNWWRQRVFRFPDTPASVSLGGWLPPVTWTHSPRLN